MDNIHLVGGVIENRPGSAPDIRPNLP